MTRAVSSKVDTGSREGNATKQERRSVSRIGEKQKRSSARALQRLLAWASPAFPIGGFAYSAGLETAISQGGMRDPAAVQAWIEGNLKSGAARNDAVLVAEAYHAHANTARLVELCDLCLALIPARQRHEELQVMGGAFIEGARAWPDPVHDRLPTRAPYPVAFGAIAGAAGIALRDTLIAFLAAYAQAQISVAVRLVPLGQASGLAILAALESIIGELAEKSTPSTLDDLGSIAFAADIAAMLHETLPTRIFRS